MCGIAGGLSLRGAPPIDRVTLSRMLGLLSHRGPEAAGVFSDGIATLGHARLSIVDLEGGLQPIGNEDETSWIVVNGEIYNHPELRAELRRQAHVFRTGSDSEVVLHLHEQVGTSLFASLNGQFAFALWDGSAKRLLLGRDRLGVRPLFFTVVDGTLLFASEIKALLADPRVARRIDLRGLDDVFTYWSPLPGRTMFAGIKEVPAGHFLTAEPGRGEPVLTQYWSPEFPGSDEFPGPSLNAVDEWMCAEELRELLVDATRLRLRADVPVGAYLSGGLDSSAIAAIVANYTNVHLQTFSVAFEDPNYDERGFQHQMAAALGTEHHVIECGHRDIGDVFPDVVWHAETPLVRTAPAPMFLLSALVRRHGLKVVLTGEGADEFFAGYNIFKEARVRRFMASAPESALRPLLLRRIYDWMPDLQRTPQSYLTSFFRQGMSETHDPAYSHLLRWRNTARLKRLFSPEVREALNGYDSRPDLDDLLSPDIGSWDPLSQAQHLEVKTFLTPYLLSSQGDRMAMANSIEGRFPFLDHRVVEFAARTPPQWRMSGLNEKRLLKRAVGDLLPPEVLHRPKRPYRAPISTAFCGPDAPSYVADLLYESAVREAGLFDPLAVRRLHAKCAGGAPISESDNMALVGVLSAQLWYDRFILGFPVPATPGRDDIVMVGPANRDRHVGPIEAARV